MHCMMHSVLFHKPMHAVSSALAAGPDVEPVATQLERPSV